MTSLAGRRSGYATYFTNVWKRPTKSPKLYLRDTGFAPFPRRTEASNGSQDLVTSRGSFECLVVEQATPYPASRPQASPSPAVAGNAAAPCPWARKGRLDNGGPSPGKTTEPEPGALPPPGREGRATRPGGSGASSAAGRGIHNASSGRVGGRQEGRAKLALRRPAGANGPAPNGIPDNEPASAQALGRGLPPGQRRQVTPAGVIAKLRLIVVKLPLARLFTPGQHRVEVGA